MYSMKMKTKGATFLLFVSLAVWLSVQAAQVDGDPDPLQQCGCTGDLFLPEESGDFLARTEIVLTAFFSFRDCINDTQAPESTTTTYHLIPAALVAVEEINNASDILTDFHVRLDIRDTQCDAAEGIYELIKSIEPRAGRNVNPPENSLNLAILGPGCSVVSQAIAGVAGRRLNISQVSYGYNSPTLASDRRKYPSFFQTAHSVDLTTMSTLRLLSYLNWTESIGVIYETSDVFTIAIEEFVRSSESPSGFEFSINNGETKIPIGRFSQITGRADQAVVRAFMNGLVQDNIRVIVALVTERFASLLLCTTRNVTIPSEGFLFVFVGSLSEDWWKDDTFCKLESREVESVIIMTSEPSLSKSSAILPSGRTLHDFKVDYTSRLRSWCSVDYLSPDPLAAATYDAVWTLAFALNNISELLRVNNTDNYQYNSVFYEAIRTSLHATDFNGVSGQVQFSENGERIGADLVLQMQNGTREMVGKFKPNEFIGGDFQWFGSTDTPSDTPTNMDIYVPIYVLIISALITVFGMLFACAMWCFNWYYAKHKILLASSQKLNYIIITGTFFAFSTVLILSILESRLGLMMSEQLFKTICIIRIWILPLSFTLSYGTMFARAWRIYRIFNDPWVSNRPLRDYHLMMIVALLALIDVLYLIPWTIVDPYRRFRSYHETNFREFTRCSFVSCSSDNLIVWLGILTLCKFLVMLAGVLVISLVRKNVNKKKYFNDSRSLASALYITALSFFIGVPVQLLLTFRQQITLSYIVGAAWVNIASYGTLIGVFIPKLYAICIKKEKGRKYKTERSIFYLQHPEISRPAGEPTSDTVGSLSDINTINQTIAYDISETDIKNIAGTE